MLSYGIIVEQSGPEVWCIQCLWALSLSCAVLQMCVECVHTCAYTKLTFHLHHARHWCSVFTALWCSFSVMKLTYLHQTPSWLWLVWTNSPVFTTTRVWNGAWTPPYPSTRVKSVNTRTLLVLTVLKWRTITTLNKKPLEKQRVQNCFASYEVQTGHFFHNVNATVSFVTTILLGE